MYSPALLGNRTSVIGAATALIMFFEPRTFRDMDRNSHSLQLADAIHLYRLFLTEEDSEGFAVLAPLRQVITPTSLLSIAP
jgi:hypothetical protein